ncbi:HAMP domain-containing histidine kinase [Actinoallomurus purpureus]|uniref:sensor histidine kinase n=1 Tax=Actinoallomurus purpureus TaxID=478114 RepID=UPI0020928C46|nr:HAMP domain-containing sensor histidine kinase [Actinoallomurus purpureus]MCO6010500.1 HAMP domain-containing histidine kinase [Actinoallomurus purpureus]
MIPFNAFVEVVAYAAGAALLVGAVGVSALYALRGRSIAALLAVVSAATVLATVAGIVAITLKMLISDHDRSVALTVTVIGGLVGLGVSLLLGHRLIGGTRSLLVSVRQAGETGRFGPPERRLPAELAELGTELSAAYERLDAARARERALESSRRELVAWVSHDLRTPLAGLRAMAEALEDEVVADAGTVRQYHAQMRAETDRLTTMVDDLFELSRIHAGALRLSRQRVGLGDLVSETVAGTEPLARAKGVRLRGQAQGVLPVEVDAAELGRALRNLVVNAIRHTPEDGGVEIVAGAEEGMAYVTVSDACGGIPDADLPRLFDVAFRGEAARTPGGGAGLGLAIARGIVEAHAGEIGVSNAGSGCRFVVRLPLGV